MDADGSRQAMARLGRAAETAKIALSDRPFVSIEEEYLLEKDGRPVHLSLELAREDYEAMIEPYIRETLEAVHTALRGASLTVADIDEILLVGGASVLGEIDGLPTLYRFAPVIHKNTPIPVTKSEVFYTVHDRQETVDVQIYQGEDRDALNNILIGRFMVEGLSKKAPSGNPIILRLALNLDGVLNVSAVEKNTGLEKSITIDNALRRYEADELESARARIGALFDEVDFDETDHIEGEILESEDDAPASSRQAGVQARALLEKAERMLEDATPEDREDMIDLIETIRDALDSDDDAALREGIEALSEILYYLES